MENDKKTNEEQASGETKFEIKEMILDMMKYAKPVVRNFPKRENRLAGRLENLMYDLLVYSIQLQKHYTKKTTLRDMDVTLDALRQFVRIASEKEYYNGGKNPVPPPLTRQQHEVWGRYIYEIGCMIGGYIAYVQQS